MTESSRASRGFRLKLNNKARRKLLSWSRSLTRTSAWLNQNSNRTTPASSSTSWKCKKRRFRRYKANVRTLTSCWRDAAKSTQ